MTVGDQMAEDEGRAMRKSPPEVCWSQSPRRMRPSLAVPDADIATAGGLPVDRNDAEPHCLAQQTGSSGESRIKLVVKLAPQDVRKKNIPCQNRILK
jgi:hypothetical protein